MMLTKHEILRVVEDYIGVDAGNLQEFSFRTLREFYSHFCGLDVPINEEHGTKRAQFMTALETATGRDQIKILRGLLMKLPKDERPTEKQKMVGLWLEDLIARLEGSVVASPSLEDAAEVVRRALDDAETLVQHNDPVSAVARAHTSLHGYVKQLCKEAKLSVQHDASLPQLFKRLRQSHPVFTEANPHAALVGQVLNSLAQAIDSLGSIRNRASVAHPNDLLIGRDEATFVRNATLTILTFLEAKRYSSPDPTL